MIVTHLHQCISESQFEHTVLGEKLFFALNIGAVLIPCGGLLQVLYGIRNHALESLDNASIYAVTAQVVIFRKLHIYFRILEVLLIDIAVEQPSVKNCVLCKTSPSAVLKTPPPYSTRKVRTSETRVSIIF